MSDRYFSCAIKNTHMLEGRRKCAKAAGDWSPSPTFPRAAGGKSMAGFSVKLKASRRA